MSVSVFFVTSTCPQPMCSAGWIAYNTRRGNRTVFLADGLGGKGRPRHPHHLFLASWSVILGKWRELGAARRATDRFLKVFREVSRLNEAAATASKYRASPLAAMFQAGYGELEAQVRSVRRDADPDGTLKLKSMVSIERALDRAMGAELERLQRALPMLATTASVTPFIGLFGTVWGIMNTFRAIGVTGSTSIVTVAPGIAEALVNTAAGLLAAIPAVVAYNHLLAKVRIMRRRMEDFELEFLNLVERNFT